MVALLLTVPAVAVMVAVCVAGTGVVLMVKFADDWFCGTTTNDTVGCAEGRLLRRKTVTPPANAGAVRVTVPCALAPPFTVAGETERLEIVAEPTGSTVRDALSAAPRHVAEIVTVRAVENGKVVMVNVLAVWPTGILVDPGTLAADGMLLVSTTCTPPVGALSANVTVPVELLPPITSVGSMVNVSGGNKVSFAVTVVRPSVAATVAVKGASTNEVSIVKLTAFWPAGTTTAAGGRTDALSLATTTVVPPTGAAPFSVTVA